MKTGVKTSMQTYTITNPPDVPGIYLLKNETTGQLYVGKSVRLKRRYTEWRAAINSNLKLHSTIVGAAIEGHWTFSVVTTCAEADLNRFEQHAIANLHGSIPDRLLNFKAPDTSKGAGSVRKSIVTGHNGVPMTYAQIADALGVSGQAIKKRLQVLRGRGINKITLEKLQQTKK